jgi:hypothetical protein
VDPGSGRGKKSGSRIRDEQSESYFRELRNQFFGLKYLNSMMRIRDIGSGMEKIQIWDPGWKKSDPGSGINIPDPQHCKPLNRKSS